MLYLARDNEPRLWAEFKKRNKNKRYVDLQHTSEGRMVRQEMRAYLVAQQFGTSLTAIVCVMPDVP